MIIPISQRVIAELDKLPLDGLFNQRDNLIFDEVNGGASLGHGPRLQRSQGCATATSGLSHFTVQSTRQLRLTVRCSCPFCCTCCCRRNGTLPAEFDAAELSQGESNTVKKPGLKKNEQVKRHHSRSTSNADGQSNSFSSDKQDRSVGARGAVSAHDYTQDSNNNIQESDEGGTQSPRCQKCHHETDSKKVAFCEVYPRPHLYLVWAILALSLAPPPESYNGTRCIHRRDGARGLHHGHRRTAELEMQSEFTSSEEWQRLEDELVAETRILCSNGRVDIVVLSVMSAVIALNFLSRRCVAALLWSGDAWTPRLIVLLPYLTHVLLSCGGIRSFIVSMCGFNDLAADPTPAHSGLEDTTEELFSSGSCTIAGATQASSLQRTASHRFPERRHDIRDISRSEWLQQLLLFPSSLLRLLEEKSHGLRGIFSLQTYKLVLVGAFLKILISDVRGSEAGLCHRALSTHASLRKVFAGTTSKLKTNSMKKLLYQAHLFKQMTDSIDQVKVKDRTVVQADPESIAEEPNAEAFIALIRCFCNFLTRDADAQGIVKLWIVLFLLPPVELEQNILHLCQELAQKEHWISTDEAEVRRRSSMDPFCGLCCSNPENGDSSTLGCEKKLLSTSRCCESARGEDACDLSRAPNVPRPSQNDATCCNSNDLSQPEVLRPKNECGTGCCASVADKKRMLQWSPQQDVARILLACLSFLEPMNHATRGQTLARVLAQLFSSPLLTLLARQKLCRALWSVVPLVCEIRGSFDKPRFCVDLNFTGKAFLALWDRLIVWDPCGSDLSLISMYLEHCRNDPVSGRKFLLFGFFYIDLLMQHIMALVREDSDSETTAETGVRQSLITTACLEQVDTGVGIGLGLSDYEVASLARGVDTTAIEGEAVNHPENSVTSPIHPTKTNVQAPQGNKTINGDLNRCLATDRDIRLAGLGIHLITIWDTVQLSWTAAGASNSITRQVIFTTFLLRLIRILQIYIDTMLSRKIEGPNAAIMETIQRIYSEFSPWIMQGIGKRLRSTDPVTRSSGLGVAYIIAEHYAKQRKPPSQTTTNGKCPTNNISPDHFFKSLSRECRDVRWFAAALRAPLLPRTRTLKSAVIADLSQPVPPSYASYIAGARPQHGRRRILSEMPSVGKSVHHAEQLGKGAESVVPPNRLKEGGCQEAAVDKPPPFVPIPGIPEHCDTKMACAKMADIKIADTEIVDTKIVNGDTPCNSKEPAFLEREKPCQHFQRRHSACCAIVSHSLTQIQAENSCCVDTDNSLHENMASLRIERDQIMLKGLQEEHATNFWDRRQGYEFANNREAAKSGKRTNDFHKQHQEKTCGTQNQDDSHGATQRDDIDGNISADVDSARRRRSESPNEVELLDIPSDGFKSMNFGGLRHAAKQIAPDTIRSCLEVLSSRGTAKTDSLLLTGEPYQQTPLEQMWLIYGALTRLDNLLSSHADPEALSLTERLCQVLARLSYDSEQDFTDDLLTTILGRLFCLSPSVVASSLSRAIWSGHVGVPRSLILLRSLEMGLTGLSNSRIVPTKSNSKHNFSGIAKSKPRRVVADSTKSFRASSLDETISNGRKNDISAQNTTSHKSHPKPDVFEACAVVVDRLTSDLRHAYSEAVNKRRFEDASAFLRAPHYMLIVAEMLHVICVAEHLSRNAPSPQQSRLRELLNFCAWILEYGTDNLLQQNALKLLGVILTRFESKKDLRAAGGIDKIPVLLRALRHGPQSDDPDIVKLSEFIIQHLIELCESLA